MRAPLLGLGTLLLLGGVLAAYQLQSTPQPAAPPERPAFTGWAPPDWLEGDAVSPWALTALDGDPLHDTGPRVQALGAFLADLDTGEVLWARAPDTPRPVASITKLVSALAMASEEPDLEALHCVGPEHYPPRPGARSRFETGVCHRGWDWLGAALIRSDNRGAMGLASVAGLHYAGFLERMAEVGEALGMNGARWADPSGIEDDNEASPRDVARAVVATAAHPVLGPIASAGHWRIERERGAELLSTTNRLVSQYEVLAAKTGFTGAAGYCFAAVLRSDLGTTLAVVVLGAPSSAARFADAMEMIQWADALWPTSASDAAEAILWPGETLAP